MSDSPPGPPRVLVAGIGNVLMQDDAFGPYFVRWLVARRRFPPAVAVRDLGTPGLDLAPHVQGLEALVLVDTVHSAGMAGEVRLYRRADILRHPPPPRTNAHDPGVTEALLLADALGVGPREVLLVGVIPASVAPGVGLSRPVTAALPAVEAAVLAELERLGLPSTPRVPPAALDVWWEPANPSHASSLPQPAASPEPGTAANPYEPPE